MKDQYFGDFGDYQKVSLLRNLRAQGLEVLVHWMKTRDDGGTDGKHITYLDTPEVWGGFDPDVYAFLKSKMNSGPRSLSHIEESEYCSGITFLGEYIENESTRKDLLERVIKSDADVVFFDPDNGIEVASTNKKNVHKYVIWAEMIEAFNAGKTVVVYQHFSRTNRENFINEKTTEIQKRIAGPVVSIQVRHSVYFFLIQKEHRTKIMAAIAAFSSIWKNLAIVR
ncbi:MAG: hypothetical protein JWL75_23 [Parcubacteria group bacterium]|nr:hypothetical protein [Parcubacteria group bacterium]